MLATEKITAQTSTICPMPRTWELWISAEHIIHWNAASDDWHTTSVKNDLRPGGNFYHRMESKDGAMGFDFEGRYTVVDPFKRIHHVMADGRHVDIQFTSDGDDVQITEIFDPESFHTIEHQRQGWQVILDNFKRYCDKLNLPC